MADKFDRKMLMIRLDWLASIVVLGYIYAVRVQSINALYVTSVLRSAIAACYMPVTHSIVPQLVLDKEDLKRAATINGTIWSGMLVIGGVVAGQASAKFGVEVCYAIDACTYMISAFVMGCVEGEYSVDEGASTKKGKDPDQKKANVLKSIRTTLQMQQDAFRYLWNSGFFLLIFLKGSGCLIWGSSDVLNVSFANVEGNEAATSKRMGMLYSSIGIGCLVGPILANLTIVDAKRPVTLQLSCIYALVFMTGGWFGLASSRHSFASVCFFTGLRTIGSAVMWLFSTLLFQNLTKPEYLGRILGLEYCVARISETIVAFIAGRMEDRGYTNSEISYFAFGIASIFLLLWMIYHVTEKGAARPKFNTEHSEVDDENYMTILT